MSNLRSKVFCIGCGKTGTTSIAAALESLGYRMGDQWVAELLIDDWARRDFCPIVEYCHSADAFQDIPFSLPDTFQAVDAAFPNSQFILTVRNDADEWFDSLTRFHTKLIGKGRLPTADDLRKYDYHGPGWMWKANALIYSPEERLLYNAELYKASYETHCQSVVAYFRNRPNDLLILNVADADAMQRLCEFLQVEYTGQAMPHLNTSRG
ncbi:MAG: hypothetical protein IT425_09030 [Pirellulales bacterium]|nr:hypothetical protein [Pirellulales bacterium]